MSVFFLLISCAVGTLWRWWKVGRIWNWDMQVLTIVARSFDQARLIRQNQWLAANGIDPSGQSLFLKF